MGLDTPVASSLRPHTLDRKRLLGWDYKAAFRALFHTLDSFVPSLDDLASVDGEFKLPHTKKMCYLMLSYCLETSARTRNKCASQSMCACICWRWATAWRHQLSYCLETSARTRNKCARKACVLAYAGDSACAKHFLCFLWHMTSFIFDRLHILFY